MSQVRADTLIEWGAEWHYQLGISEVSSPPDAWRFGSFPVAEWPKGPAPLGYGEPDIITAIPSSGEGGWLTVYFRRDFVVSNPAGISQLDLNVRVDDGFIAWINGIEVGRYNAPGGDPAYDTTSLSAIEPSAASLTLTNNLGQFLVPGVNTLAIQVLNANWGSTDLLFETQLLTTSDTTAPVIAELVPPAGGTVREFAQLQVIFDESVTGVDPADLMVNGAAANQVTPISPREYIFHFPEPPNGTVQLAWSTGHQITDLASPANAFAGGSWTVNLDPTSPLPTVMISEFMADNTAGIKDDSGSRSDWIELLNPSAEPVDLQGWFLTDDPAQLTKWRFPKQVLPPNAYLLVWASEQDRTNAAAPLHTNFKLSTGGEYLALVGPQTNIFSEFAPTYPAQQANISYGRDRLNAELTGYFSIPTPGKPNTASGTGFAPTPEITVPSGTYTNNTLTVTISAPAGEIHYTEDGSIPTLSSPIYTQPLALSTSTVLQARVFQTGLLPGELVIRVYTLLNAGFDEFSSNLPVMVIQTGGRGIPQDQRVRAFVSTFEPHDGRAHLASNPDFESAAEIEVRGQTSSGFPKQPYNLEIQDPYGNDREAELLGLPAESDWVLHNPYSDKCLMNNFLTFELHRKMGHYAPRCRFVEVFIKTSRTRLSYPGDYKGVYVLMEKIKIDGNRVDLARLGPGQNQEPEISGGYIIKKDKGSPGDLDFWTDGGGEFSGQFLKYHDPKPQEITDAQQNWIREYLNQFERTLYATDWLRRTGTNHYSHYIDVDSFVDYHWIVEFTKQIDGYRLSNFMSKDRGGKLKMEPIWDWNLAWGNADYLEGWNTNGWYYTLTGESDHPWLRRLISGTPNAYDKRGDPDFNQRIIDRWSALRTNILAASNVTTRVDEIAAELDEAQGRDFAKYRRLNTYVWPNPSFYIAPTYSAIIQAMKRWINGRFAWIDSQFVKAPQLGAPPGPVQSGQLLTLSAPSGSLLFTLDGSDPRLPGGGVSPLARTYAGQPLAIDRNVRVFARARGGTNWSGPAVGTYIVQTPPLVITEIMYQPESVADDTQGEHLEFIELKNIGSSELDLRGFRFTNGIEFAFTAASSVTNLAPGAHVVLVKDRAAFVSRYPGAAARVGGEFQGSLDNAGERIALEGPLQEPILNFAYRNDWYPITAGAGFSLVTVDDHAPLEAWSARSNWRASGRSGGSPGEDDPLPPAIAPVVVNELLTRPDPPQLDAVELLNPGTNAVDIGGWFLSDDPGTPGKFRLPDATVLPPGGFVVFDRLAFGGTNGFAFRAAGDEVLLFSAASGELTGFLHGFAFGAADPGVSFGRVVTSTGEERFAPQLRTTLGSANAGPRVGPVVINEIMFRPAEVGTNGAALDEYVELHNITDQPVLLSDAVVPSNTWRLRGGADFEFPAATLSAGGFALVVGFDPANSAALAGFRSAYAVPVGTPVFGPFRGKLNNRGERITLSKPTSLDTLPSQVGSDVPHVMIDQVQYGSSTPWPDGASGSGKSLQRIDPAQFGDDPINWVANSPTAGKANSALPMDFDGDGLPDPWESVHFGGLNAGPGDDPDGDGMTNLQEFVAGSSPTDSASTLGMAIVRSPSGQLALEFQAATGRVYAVFSSEDIEGPWSQIEDLPAPTGPGRYQFPIEVPGQSRYFRLAVSLSPIGQ